MEQAIAVRRLVHSVRPVYSSLSIGGIDPVPHSTLNTHRSRFFFPFRHPEAVLAGERHLVVALRDFEVVCLADHSQEAASDQGSEGETRADDHGSEGGGERRGRDDRLKDARGNNRRHWGDYRLRAFRRRRRRRIRRPVPIPVRPSIQPVYFGIRDWVWVGGGVPKARPGARPGAPLGVVLGAKVEQGVE